MNWEALGAIGEIVGAVAVVVTLGYLAVQIRQNTRSSRATAFQAASSEVNQIYRAVASDSELARIFQTGISEPQTLDQFQLFRFGAILHAVFKGYENMFTQYHEGTVDDQTWEAWRRSMVSMLELPGVAQFWELRGGVFREDLQDLVKQLAPSGFPAPGIKNPSA